MRTRSTMDAGAWPGMVGSPSPQRIRWGAVFGGAVIGIALLALLSTLWFALAFGSEVASIRDNLAWFVGISAVVCLFLAGLMAGWLSGVNGVGSGFFNGVTIWALMLILTVTVGVPATIDVFNLGRVTAIDATAGGLIAAGDGSTILWAAFASILGGLIASGLGGMIGGAMARPANAHLVDTDVVEERPVAERTVEERPVAERTVEERTETVADRPMRPDLDDDRERTVVVSDDADEETVVRRRVS